MKVSSHLSNIIVDNVKGTIEYYLRMSHNEIKSSHSSRLLFFFFYLPSTATKCEAWKQKTRKLQLLLCFCFNFPSFTLNLIFCKMFLQATAVNVMTNCIYVLGLLENHSKHQLKTACWRQKITSFGLYLYKSIASQPPLPSTSKELFIINLGCYIVIFTQT